MQIKILKLDFVFIFTLLTKQLTFFETFTKKFTKIQSKSRNDGQTKYRSNQLILVLKKDF